MIEINYGAKNIDDFIEKLQKYTLDPQFEQYGNFIRKNPKFPKNPEMTEKYKGWYSLFGNFYDYSNAFSILINDEKLVKKLRRLIRKNQRSEKYVNARNGILQFENHIGQMKNERIKRLDDMIK